MKIYKEDYKHFRACQKLSWFLNEQNFHLAKKLIDDKKITTFVELTNTKTSSKIDNTINNISDLEVLENNINISGDDSDDFYVGETIADGLETGKYAQEYFQKQYKCFNFETNNVVNAQLLLNSHEYDVFFEPRFEFNGCVTKCDILKRNGSEWDLIEVKAVTWVKEEHMWDLLYQFDILSKCGIKINNVYIMHLNNKYFLKDKLDLEQLFIAYDSQWQKSNGAKKFFNLYDSIQEELTNYNLGEQYKVIKKILTIKDEQKILDLLFNKYCDEKQQKFCHHIFPYFETFNTIFQLYRLRKNKKATWYYENDLLSLQDSRLLTHVLNNKFHLRQYDIANNGEKILDYQYLPQLKKELEKYRYPVYMYDFETMKSAIPKFKNSNPYQQIPFQYSVHVLLNSDFDFMTLKNIKHYQFLADGQSDPRLELVKNLCHDLIAIHGLGTYVAYNQSFEKSIIKNLIINFKLFQDSLTQIFNNTIDLQDFFKDFKIYKSQFSGSLSIKKTLPAFDKNFSYEDLSIKKGDMASEVFRRRVENNISLKKWYLNFYQNMLDYCQRDTFGMVILFWHIKKLIQKADIEDINVNKEQING